MTEPPRQRDGYDSHRDYDGHRGFRGCIIGTIISLPMWAVMLWLILR